ncbi:MAG: polyprenol monophosphomannose synthase [Fuerstiella sp.]
MSSELLITVCTFNEAENIGSLLSELRRVAPDADILVIDDNSPDGTADLVKQYSLNDTQVDVLVRTSNKGLGASTVDGFQYGIDHKYRYLLNLDADFSHQPKHIPDLLAAMESHDVCIGSRYIPGGSITGWKWTRHVMSRCVNFYVHVWLRLKAKDSSGSFRCYHVAKLAEIDWSKTVSRGYAFQEEVLYRCQRIECSFAEVPIAFEDRTRGTTNLNTKEIVRAIWDLFKLGIHRLRGISVRHDSK